LLVAVEATVIFYVGDTQSRGQSVSGEEKPERGRKKNK